MQQLLGQKRAFNEETIKIAPSELLNKFRSKSDLYNYLTFQVGLFLPSLNNTRIDFLRKIVNGQKLALKMTQIKCVGVPKFPELSVQNLLDYVSSDDEFMKYLPDFDKQGQKARIERDFLVGIMFTLKEKEFKVMINDAMSHRHGGSDQQNHLKTIIATQEWADKLMEFPFQSKKKGRSIYLMQDRKLVQKKQNIKIGDIKNEFKRKHLKQENQIMRKQQSHSQQFQQEEQKDDNQFSSIIHSNIQSNQSLRFNI